MNILLIPLTGNTNECLSPGSLKQMRTNHLRSNEGKLNASQWRRSGVGTELTVNASPVGPNEKSIKPINQSIQSNYFEIFI